MITSIKRSALVMYSDQAMFDLVNDVSKYPQFMDGCIGTEIYQQTTEIMVARLDLKKGAVATSFTTRNKLIAPSQIELSLEDGPFKKLSGLWTFKALTDKACKVSLDLDFEFESISVGIATSTLFSNMANNLVDSLSRRATALYG